MRILIADDAEGIRSSIAELLRDRHEVVMAADGQEAIKILEASSIDLVITDNNMPNVTGIELIRQAKTISPDTSLILMTAAASSDESVEALQLGADDFFGKPFQFAEVLHRVQRVEDHRRWSKLSTLSKALEGKGLVSGSWSADAQAFVTKAAGQSEPVLLLGSDAAVFFPFAHAIHESSSRALWPLVSISCAQERFDESLYGEGKKAGWLELIGEGALFLDGVERLTSDQQTKLAKVLETRKFQRVGTSREIGFGARLFAGLAKGELGAELMSHFKVCKFEFK